MKKYFSISFAILFFICLLSCAWAQILVPEMPNARRPKALPKADFALTHAGQFPIPYQQFGTFKDLGTPHFSYQIKDLQGLKEAMPEGLYPNQDAVKKNPDFKKLKKQGTLKVDRWKILNSTNTQAAFFVWATSKEARRIEPAVGAYFTAQILERSGNLVAALNAYESILIFYPQSFSYTSDGKSVWYLAAAALSDIRRISRDYPALGYQYAGALVEVDTHNDADISNDSVKVVPGQWKKRSVQNTMQHSIAQKRGHGKVKLVQYDNGHWQMLVNDEPFMVKGILYAPTQVGQGPYVDHNFSAAWMFSDLDKDGKIDSPYQAWVDANNNGQRDANEPAVGDFALLAQMGANAIKMYHYPKKIVAYDPTWANKNLLRDLYKKHGIRVIMGDFLGAYTIGSNANWDEGTDYTNPEQRALMKSIIRDLVLDFKDEDFMLMWVLGNENNMPSQTSVNATKTNACSQPKAYAEFLNEVATLIHELDPNHPVAIGNLETPLLDIYARYAPEIDIVGINSYRGQNGFGLLWDDVKRTFDRPVLLTEYGSDAYLQDRGIDEDAQAQYIEGNTRDIAFNAAGSEGAGNAIGGCVFEFLDEWWKDTSDAETHHQTQAQQAMPFSDGQGHEEWFGVVGQGDGQASPFERHLRKAYYVLQSLWKI